ncbi:MAG: 50S ribosomal protein L30 [Syntrophomonadaceae bacterium]|nr:50S ribosomal protein L30 [Syntrophomonadaceae bacterium]
MSKQLKITWTRSIIGCPETQRKTIRSLGFRKMQQSILKEDSPQIRGQIKKVQHLVTVEEIE